MKKSNLNVFDRPRGSIGLFTGLAVVGIMAVLAETASAQNGPPPGRGGRHGPPPEAIEACKGKAKSDKCQMKIPHEKSPVPGQCIETPEKTIACLPEGAPRGPRPPRRPAR